MKNIAEKKEKQAIALSYEVGDEAPKIKIGRAHV